MAYNVLQIGVVADYINENYMKNKDIHEWLLDEGIDPLTTVTTEKGEYFLADILEKHLTEQLRLFAVSGRSEQFVCLCPRNKTDNCDRKEPCKECETCPHFRQTNCH